MSNGIFTAEADAASLKHVWNGRSALLAHAWKEIERHDDL
jgi:hypothetical protein